MQFMLHYRGDGVVLRQLILETSVEFLVQRCLFQNLPGVANPGIDVRIQEWVFHRKSEVKTLAFTVVVMEGTVLLAFVPDLVVVGNVFTHIFHVGKRTILRQLRVVSVKRHDPLNSARSESVPSLDLLGFLLQLAVMQTLSVIHAML